MGKLSDSQRFAKPASPPVPPDPALTKMQTLLQVLPPQGKAGGALVLGPANEPMVVFSPDNITVEWGKPFPTALTDEQRRQYADAPDQPTLIVAGPFGKLRVFPPPAVVKVLGNDLEPLLAGLASHEIDRLPWRVEVEDSMNFNHATAPVLSR